MLSNLEQSCPNSHHPRCSRKNFMKMLQKVAHTAYVEHIKIQKRQFTDIFFPIKRLHTLLLVSHRLRCFSTKRLQPMTKKVKQDLSVLKKERQFKADITTYHDKRRNAKLIDINVGDKVLRPQKKSTVKTQFDPASLTVVQKKGYLITGRTQQGKLVTRAANKFKKVTARDPFFSKRSQPRTHTKSDLDDDFLFWCRQKDNAAAPPLPTQAETSSDVESSDSDTIPYRGDEEREVEDIPPENSGLRRQRKAPKYLDDYEL